jgi:threonine dehydratase
MQPTFSFNLRGAYNKIANLTPAQRERGIVACAAGNHLEGVAYAAAKLDVDAIVIAPVGTAQNISHSTKNKITIVEHGADFDASLVRRRCCVWRCRCVGRALIGAVRSMGSIAERGFPRRAD